MLNKSAKLKCFGELFNWFGHFDKLHNNIYSLNAF